MAEQVNDINKMDYMQLKRQPNENEFAFIWRLGEAKSNGLLDMTWTDLASIINEECREDDLVYGESVYRKQFTTSKLFYDNVFVDKLGGNEYIKALKQQQDDIFKAKRQLYDQRREYNKNLTYDARNDHLTEELIKAAEKLPELVRIDMTGKDEADEYNEAVLYLSDWHVGLVANNIWNIFNPAILQERISKLVNDTKRYLIRHKPKALHVVILGDMVQGNLIPVSQTEASELGCEQIMKASEILSEVVSELSNYVENTVVYSTYGNHGRTTQNIKDSVHNDNMERLIPWWMAQRLSGIKEIKFIDGVYEFIRTNACGYEIGSVHGDLDKSGSLGNTMVAVFNKKFGVTPRYAVMGHIHHNSSLDNYGIETIVVGSLSGSDSYANGKRLYATPSQTLLFFNKKDGLECRYNILFRDEQKKE